MRIEPERRQLIERDGECRIEGGSTTAEVEESDLESLDSKLIYIFKVCLLEVCLFKVIMFKVSLLEFSLFKVCIFYYII